MLQTLGLDAIAERVYRNMLVHPRDTLAELASRLDLTREQIQDSLDRLSSLALVGTSSGPSGFRAVSASIGMDALLAKQQADLAAQHERLEASRAAAARLVAQCTALGVDNSVTAAEELVGISEIRARLAEITAEAKEEIMTFSPGGAHAEADMSTGRLPDSELLARGVAVRTVHLDSIRNHAPTLAHVQWLAGLGAQARTAATLPLRMIIVDRELAVVPGGPDDAPTGAVVLRGQGVMTAMCALFEMVWSTSTQLADPGRRDAQGLSAQDLATLRLLRSGITDEAIASRMGVSPRTTRRTVARLMRLLGAKSRFEAGCHAVEAGWFSSRG